MVGMGWVWGGAVLVVMGRGAGRAEKGVVQVWTVPVRC